MDDLKSVTNWTFLQEPAWRWAIFVGVMILILASWRCILAHMKIAG